jgi:hypothetical protein
MATEFQARIGASRLKVLQFSKYAPPDAPGVVRYLTRKELLDEVNRRAAPEWQWSSPSSPGGFRTPGTAHRQASIHVNVLKPRDVRKVDPTFATRLEP